MNGVHVTLVGTVATRPEVKMHNDAMLVSFRMVAKERRFDKQAGAWTDGAETWATVTCWRTLAVNVESSVMQRDRVVVHGRLRTNQWEQNGVRRSDVAVTADVVGHDLGFGTAVFSRRSRRDDEVLAALQAEAELVRRVADLPVGELDDPTPLDPPYDISGAVDVGPLAGPDDDGPDGPGGPGDPDDPESADDADDPEADAFPGDAVPVLAGARR